MTSSLKYVYDLGSKSSLYGKDNLQMKTEALQVMVLCFAPNLKECGSYLFKLTNSNFSIFITKSHFQ